MPSSLKFGGSDKDWQFIPESRRILGIRKKSKMDGVVKTRH